MVHASIQNLSGLIWVFGVLTSVLCSSQAQADQLLIIADSQYMFGAERMSLGFERFGSRMVEEKIGSRYRKVYAWTRAEGVPFPEFWQQVIRERREGETIDVFAMEHGPTEFMSYDGFVAKEEVPHGYIRRYYSTGCQNWGAFTSADLLFQTAGFYRKEWLSSEGHQGFTTSEYLQQLGVREYVLHANNNSTGILSLPYLLDEFQKNESWTAAAAAASSQIDDVTAALGIPLQNIALVFGYLDPLMTEDVLADVHFWLKSRLVLGGQDLQRMDLQNSATMIDVGEDEALLVPNANLRSFFEENCPIIFSDVDCRRQVQEPSVKWAFLTAFELFYDLFSKIGAFDEAQRACMPAAVFQELINVHFIDEEMSSPQVERFCLSRRDRGDGYVLEWEFENAKQEPYWFLGSEVPLDEDLKDARFRGARLKNKGRIDVSFKEGGTRLRFRGVGLKLNGVPRIFSRAGLHGLDIQDEGFYKLRTSVLYVPVSFSGNFIEEVLTRFRIFGLKLGTL